MKSEQEGHGLGWVLVLMAVVGLASFAMAGAWIKSLNERVSNLEEQEIKHVEDYKRLDGRISRLAVREP